MTQPRNRPSWIVLAKGTLKQVRAVAEEEWRGLPERLWERWGIVRSRKGWVAVYEPDPGAQHSGFAASSWRHIHEHEREDIGYILDDPDPEKFSEVFAALEHADAEVRLVAASLLHYARPSADWRALVAERREAEKDAAVRRAIEETLEYWRERDE